MDHRDHLRALPDGLACTVCNEPVPADRIRLLARREDLTFIQVDCARCGSATLEFVAEARPVGAVSDLLPAITTEDVFAIHEFLDDWQGDLRTLFSTRQGVSSPSERGPLA